MSCFFLREGGATRKRDRERGGGKARENLPHAVGRRRRALGGCGRLVADGRRRETKSRGARARKRTMPPCRRSSWPSRRWSPPGARSRGSGGAPLGALWERKEETIGEREEGGGGEPRRVSFAPSLCRCSLEIGLEARGSLEGCERGARRRTGPPQCLAPLCALGERARSSAPHAGRRARAQMKKKVGSVLFSVSFSSTTPLERGRVSRGSLQEEHGSKGRASDVFELFDFPEVLRVCGSAIGRGREVKGEGGQTGGKPRDSRAPHTHPPSPPFFFGISHFSATETGTRHHYSDNATTES